MIHPRVPTIRIEMGKKTLLARGTQLRCREPNGRTAGRMRKIRIIMRAIALGVGLAAPAGAALSQEAKIAIEDLLKAGWQVAGYTSADDSRSTFILFRHPTETHLVQCRAGYDVTREPRVQTNCYRLR
jgi:hypothetical protein